jgi:DNA-binding HxlR family transcriptional regulator
MQSKSSTRAAARVPASGDAAARGSAPGDAAARVPASGDAERCNVARMVEDIVGCKWSLAVLARVRAGTRRPGALEHSLPGLSAKVLGERLRKLTRYGILQRTQFPEIPPRVEYELTPFGREFVTLLDAIDALQARIDGRGST